MTEDQDQRIVDLLRSSAPPARDPVFRIKVLERREQRQFQRRSLTMLLGALVMILVSVLAIRIGGAALETMGPLAVGTTLACACLAFRRSLPKILRRFSL